MPLSSDPSVTYNAAGNALAAQALAASASVTFVVDCSSSSLGAYVQIWNGAGASVAATAGLQVQVFPAGDSTPGYDTVAMWSFTITSTASTTNKGSVLLPTGKFQIKLTNLDATNGLTNVEATSNPIA